MLVILPLVLLALFHQQIQPIQAISVALPLAMRSPTLSYWLPQNDGSATNYTSESQVSSLKLNSNWHL